CGGAPALVHVGHAADVHRHLPPGFAGLRVPGGQRRGTRHHLLRDLPGGGPPLPDDDVAACVAGGVEPQIGGTRLPEGEGVIVAGGVPDQDLEVCEIDDSPASYHGQKCQPRKRARIQVPATTAAVARTPSHWTWPAWMLMTAVPAARASTRIQSATVGELL